jgi:N-acetylmuramoyl-L-alanine amidase
VIQRCLQIRTLLLALAAVTAHAQTSTPVAPKKPRPKAAQPALNPNIVFLDPAHGGPDNGTTLAPDSLEKDATVAFAVRLKTTLTAHGFAVIVTHESSADQPTPDQRAELANHSRAATCLLLHASNSGHGVHLFTSSLTPISPLSASFEGGIGVLPWATAQAMSLQQSLRLTFDLSDAFHAIRLPLVVGHASPAPIDSMTCPAVVIELAPLTSDDQSTAASDPAYQQRVADAINEALVAWRTRLVAEANPDAQPATPAPKPAAPVVRPKPIVPPIETPDIVPAEKPATKPALKSDLKTGVPQ